MASVRANQAAAAATAVNARTCTGVTREELVTVSSVDVVNHASHLLFNLHIPLL